MSAEKPDFVEETRQWAEQSRRIKEGDPKAIAEREAEKKALHDRIWKGEQAEKLEDKTPREIKDTKKELEEMYEKQDSSDKKESSDQKAAREIIEQAKTISFEDMLHLSEEIYRRIKDINLRDETNHALGELMKQKSQEDSQKMRERDQQIIEDFKAGKITMEEAEKRLGVKKTYSWEKKKKYSWEK